MNILDNLGLIGDGKTHQSLSDSAKQVASSSRSDQVYFSSEASVKTHLLIAGTEGGNRVFAKSVETNLSLSVSVERSEFELKVPSPSDVANTILGFVERRIDSEISNGADESRITNLLDQARRGIEAGFSSAIEDINSLGLMNDELEEDIGRSRALVDDGIDKIQEDYTGTPISTEIDQEVDVQPVSPSVDEVKLKEQQSSLNVYEFFKPSTTDSAPSQVSSLNGVSQHKFASHESSEFSLLTNDGDKVSIRFSESFAAVSRSSEGEYGLALAADQAFQFSVEGELDEEEIEAINQLLSQVGQVTELFFQNSFQDAFETALTIGFDTSEIAAFSLDLSKAVVQEVRTYGESSGAGKNADFNAINRYQPIIDMANHFSNIKDAIAMFEPERESVTGLIRETLERTRELISDVRDSSSSEEPSLDRLQDTKIQVSQLIEFSEYILLSESA